MNIFLPDIDTNYAGFSSLTDIHNKINESITGEALTINMPDWFSANMCSPFGAILGLAKNNKRVESISFEIGNERVKEILKKNNFLSYIGCNIRPLQDVYGNTIIYRQFFSREDWFFINYIKEDLMRRIPPMSDVLSKRFEDNLFEIFNNAVTHSGTNTVFVCGQGFPHKNIIDFSIADIGMGFHKNVTSLMGLNLTHVEAIEWAMQGNTTKKGSIPGGAGLKTIKEFIIHNKGKMQIASDRGYWELSNGEIMTRAFSTPFPGSVVNIEINTTDACTYNLHDKVKLDDIF